MGFPLVELFESSIADLEEPVHTDLVDIAKSIATFENCGDEFVECWHSCFKASTFDTKCCLLIIMKELISLEYKVPAFNDIRESVFLEFIPREVSSIHKILAKEVLNDWITTKVYFRQEIGCLIYAIESSMFHRHQYDLYTLNMELKDIQFERAEIEYQFINLKMHLEGCRYTRDRDDLVAERFISGIEFRIKVQSYINGLLEREIKGTKVALFLLQQIKRYQSIKMQMSHKIFLNLETPPPPFNTSRLYDILITANTGSLNELILELRPRITFPVDTSSPVAELFTKTMDEAVKLHEKGDELLKCYESLKKEFRNLGRIVQCLHKKNSHDFKRMKCTAKQKILLDLRIEVLEHEYQKNKSSES